MGERKGVNKYYPPDWTPAMGSLNEYHGTHALRERARKLKTQGILIIRFEMPYNIWCGGCGNHVGMGVRYNAEKKKVGMYYTTPVYQFRMKCHLCDNHFEMKTDPQNLDYEIVSGARRQERRWDPTNNEQVVPEDKLTSQKLASDPMFKLEHGDTDRKKSTAVAPSLAKLEDLQTRWKDDYTSNKLLRQQFRDRKKEIANQNDTDRRLLAKSSLNISLVPEHPEDKRLAGLLRLTQVESVDDKKRLIREEIQNRSIFSTLGQLPKNAASSTTTPNTKSGATKSTEENIKDVLMKNCHNKKLQTALNSLSATKDLGIRRSKSMPDSVHEQVESKCESSNANPQKDCVPPKKLLVPYANDENSESDDGV